MTERNTTLRRASSVSQTSKIPLLQTSASQSVFAKTIQTANDRKPRAPLLDVGNRCGPIITKNGAAATVAYGAVSFAATNENHKPLMVRTNRAAKLLQARNVAPLEQKDACGITTRLSKLHLTDATSSYRPPLRRTVSQQRVVPPSQQMVQPISFDLDHEMDPQAVSEYANDIVHYCLQLERKHTVKIGYLQSAEYRVTPSMRTVLVGWLVDLQGDFKLVPETLFSAVNLVDLYVERHPTNVTRRNLQLLGSACMCVSAKFEELEAFHLNDFVVVGDGAFTLAHLRNMEIKVLRSVGDALMRPSGLFFLRRYSKLLRVDREHHSLAKYLLELSLLEHRCAHALPSKMAAAAICLAQAILTGSDEQQQRLTVANQQRFWPQVVQVQTTYRFVDFEMMVYQLGHLLANCELSKHGKSIHRKYSGPRFCKIATHPNVSTSTSGGGLVRTLADKYQKICAKQH